MNQRRYSLAHTKIQSLLLRFVSLRLNGPLTRYDSLQHNLRNWSLLLRIRLTSTWINYFSYWHWMQPSMQFSESQVTTVSLRKFTRIILLWPAATPAARLPLRFRVALLSPYMIISLLCECIRLDWSHSRIPGRALRHGSSTFVKKFLISLSHSPNSVSMRLNPLPFTGSCNW